MKITRFVSSAYAAEHELKHWGATGIPERLKEFKATGVTKFLANGGVGQEITIRLNNWKRESKGKAYASKL